MECRTCKQAYNNRESIPLTCKCGTTQCRKCVLNLSENNTFNCQICKKSTKIQDLTINRAIEDMTQVIIKIKQSKEEIPKVKKIFFDKPEKIKGSVIDNKQTDSNTLICINQSTEAFVQFDSHKVQTAKSFVSIEKIKLKVLSVKIVWKKCFLISVYFLFQSPWVFLAVFGFDKGQEEKLTWIGVWLLNFCVFCYFFILNSGLIDDYQAIKAKNWKTVSLILSVVFETCIICYGWFMYLKEATGSFLHKDQLSSALGITLTGTFFNSLMLVLIVFILVSGHPLIHTPRKLDTKKFTYNKSISLKFLVFIVLFIIPDLLIISSKIEILSYKTFFFFYYYEQVFSFFILVICQNRFKPLTLCIVVVISFHFVSSIAGYAIFEGLQIYKIYNAIIDVICLMAILLGVKKIAAEMLRNKNQDYKLL